MSFVVVFCAFLRHTERDRSNDVLLFFVLTAGIILRGAFCS